MHDYLPQIEKGLHSDEPYVRGASALALARMLGTAAQPKLDGLEREAADELELIFVLSAQIHAGHRNGGHELRKVLQEFSNFHLLRLCWKREVLFAIQASGSDNTRDAALWAEAAHENLDRVLSEIRALVPDTPQQSVDLKPSTEPTLPKSNRIFVSYSHHDKRWLEIFRTSLAPMIRSGTIDLWDDTKLQLGSKWHSEIDRAMDDATVALLLVSKNFLNSEFVARHELPKLLKAAEERDVKIVWVALEDCLYEETEIADYQCANNPRQPLTGLSPHDQDRVVMNICRSLRDMLKLKRG